jgi:hypothetical protein
MGDKDFIGQSRDDFGAAKGRVFGDSRGLFYEW